MSTEKEQTALAIAITSGKGGVGKTNVTTNLGIALAKANSRVCVLDGDTSLANINILLNLSPAATLDHYLRGEKPLEEILLTGPRGLTVVPSATGITDCIDFTEEQRGRLLDCLRHLESNHDYLLIDTAAGVGEGVLQFIESAQYAIVVISPEPTSLTDAFSLIKVLKRRDYQQPIYILVNMTNSYGHSMEVFKRFAHAVNKYVEIKVRYLGYIPLDKAVTTAVTHQSPLVLSAPDSPAGRCYALLANILLKHFSGGDAPVRKISQFWRSQLASNPVSDSPVGDVPADEASTVSDIPVPAHNDAVAQTQAQHEEVTERSLPDTQEQNATASQVPASKTEAEEQLAALIQHYLTSYGSLPQQAIDLILQAYDQEELPELAHQQLNAQIPRNHEVLESLADQDIEMADQNPSTTSPLAQEIDELVDEAERTKARLTELAEHIRNQYRRLYNTDINHPTPELRSVAPTTLPESVVTPQIDEKAGLQQSIRLASSVDKK